MTSRAPRGARLMSSRLVEPREGAECDQHLACIVGPFGGRSAKRIDARKHFEPELEDFVRREIDVEASSERGSAPLRRELRQRSREARERLVVPSQVDV